MVTTPHHRFTLNSRQGSLALRVEATLSAPWTVLFGPSGSGKSTLLRAIAGLMPRAEATLDRWSAERSAWLPLGHTAPEHRALGYAPQGALLLPHLSVADNLRFPESLRRTLPWSSRVPALVELFQLEPLLPKRPNQLSGGERQRASLARALAVPGAQLALLDEPFAGLDRARRDALLPGLRGFLAEHGLPVLSVTHDPDEALLLQADVLRLDNGQLTAHGPAGTVLADEVARLQTLLSGVPES